MGHRVSDNAHFEAFQKGFIAENANSHEAIHRLLGKLVKRVVATAKDTEGVADSRRDAIESAERRRGLLMDRARQLPLEAQKQALALRRGVQRQASRENRAIRGRIRVSERSNRSKLVELQEKNSEQHARHSAVLARVRELQQRESTLVARGTKDLDPVEGRLVSLKMQLDALVSAAAAVPTVPEDRHNALLRMVSSAIGANAHAADAVERVGMEVRNLTARAGGRPAVRASHP
jgi:hypothetical protein